MQDLLLARNWIIANSRLSRLYARDVNKDLTPKDQDKDKDLTPKDPPRTRTKTRT